MRARHPSRQLEQQVQEKPLQVWGGGACTEEGGNKRCCTFWSRDLDRRVQRRRPPPPPQPPPPSASLLYERAVGQTKPRRRRQRNELGLDTAPACLCCLTGHHRIPLRDKSVCFYLLFPPPSPPHLPHSGRCHDNCGAPPRK